MRPGAIADLDLLCGIPAWPDRHFQHLHTHDRLACWRTRRVKVGRAVHRKGRLHGHEVRPPLRHCQGTSVYPVRQMGLTDCVKAGIRPPRGFAEGQMDLHAPASVAELGGLLAQGWVYRCLGEQGEIELVWCCARHYRLGSTELAAVCGADAHRTTVFHDDFLDEC